MPCTICKTKTKIDGPCLCPKCWDMKCAMGPDQKRAAIVLRSLDTQEIRSAYKDILGHQGHLAVRRMLDNKMDRAVLLVKPESTCKATVMHRLSEAVANAYHEDLISPEVANALAKRIALIILAS